ncbi:MAG TPA: glycosyltransferase, partial [Rhodoglobus sp.]|nr:glycosyltransferase [Rhodoglobus sp.]
MHPRPSDRAITLGRVAIIATIVFWAVYVVTTIIRQFIDNGTVSFRFTMEAISYVVVVTFLTFSALMYLVARQGAMQRFRDHVRVPRAELDRHFADGHGSMTVLVPSYAEEPDVVRGTLWSAALQEYPSLRVVLLLDDPPNPKDPKVRARLDATRDLPAQIEAELAVPAGRFADALLHAELAVAAGDAGPWLVEELRGHYRWAARWLSDRAAGERLDDHVDVFFANEV